MPTARILAEKNNFEKRTLKAFDESSAECDITNAVKMLTGVISDKPKYAIDAAIECLRTSISSPDFITESECFEECLRRSE